MMLRTQKGILFIIVAILCVSVGCTKSVDVTAVRLSETSLDLTMGETATLVAKVEPAIAEYDAISWISSDPSVATVSGGRVVVHKVGTAMITASAGGVTSGICTINVSAEPAPEVPAVASTDEPAETTSAESTDGTDDEAGTEGRTETETEAGSGTQEEGSDTATEEEGSEEATSADSGAPAEIASEGGQEAETETDTEAEAATETGSKFHFIYDVDFGEDGSYIPIDSLVTLQDWRGRDFNDYPTYWDYYGPVEINFDLANAECDLNGTRQILPQSITLVQTEAGSTIASDPESGAKVSMPANRNGFLMCKFATVGLTEDFNIFVKARVKYGFGTIQTDWIRIHVIIDAGQ